MKLIFTLLVFFLSFNFIYSSEQFNSFSIKGEIPNCSLVIGTNNKCVNACDKSFSIERKYMSSVNQENLYIFRSYDNDVNCKKNILGVHTEFTCVKDSKIVIDNINIECKFSTEDEIKERDTNTLINAQINEQINQQQHQQRPHNQTQQINKPKEQSNNNNNNNNQPQQQQIQQQDNEEKSNSSILIYSSYLIIISLLVIIL